MRSRRQTRSDSIAHRCVPFLFALSVCAAHAEDGFALQKGVIPAAPDYQGVAIGDATDEIYLYLPREKAQGRLLHWQEGRAMSLPLPSDSSPGSEAGAGWADYDADGDLDLYVSRYGLADLLFDNREGEFIATAPEHGFGDTGPGQGVTWIDYDRDGSLDLHVARFGQANLLYNRKAGGGFVDHARDAGIDNRGPSTCGVWADFDADGDVDVYIVNYQGKDHLYRNHDGRFLDAAADYGLGDDGAGVGATWVDWDNDGDLDLSLSRYDEADRLMQNDLDGGFTDVAAKVRLDDRGQGQMVAWGDFDRDGDQDAYVVNGGEARDVSRLYRNDGGFFVDATVEAGLIDRSSGAARRSKAAVWWDANGDGALDLLTIAKGKGTDLLLNQAPEGDQNWFAFRIQGEGSSNPNAFGGTAFVHRADQRTTAIPINGVTSYLSQGSQRGYVGLGKTGVDSVEMIWPEIGGRVIRSKPTTRPLYLLTRDGAKAEVSPRRIDFSDVSASLSATRQLSIRNSGEAVLRLDSVEVRAEAGTESPFSENEPEWPIIVEADSTREIDIVFHPTSEGVARAELKLHANTDVPTVHLVGKGSVQGEIVLSPSRFVLVPGSEHEFWIERSPTGIGIREVRLIGPAFITLASGMLWQRAKSDLDNANRQFERSAFHTFAQGFNEQAEDASTEMWKTGVGVLVGGVWGVFEYWAWRRDAHSVSSQTEVGIIPTDGRSVVLHLTRRW